MIARRSAKSMGYPFPAPAIVSRARRAVIRPVPPQP